MKLFGERKLSAKDLLVKSIRERDVSGIVGSLGQINTLLGLQPNGDFQPELKDQLEEKARAIAEAQEFEAKTFYLGDGGLSRVVAGRDGERIVAELTSNSTDSTKSKWKELFGK